MFGHVFRVFWATCMFSGKSGWSWDIFFFHFSSIFARVELELFPHSSDDLYITMSGTKVITPPWPKRKEKKVPTPHRKFENDPYHPPFRPKHPKMVST